jgi:Uma2 family endonuclease
MTVAAPELFLRSPNGGWTYELWETLPDDGNRYEVIDGVLYMSTSPSVFHQWLSQLLVELVGIPARREGWAYYFIAPIGLLMPGGTPVQPDFCLIRRERASMIYDKRIRGVPDLIAEILSPSNSDYDTDTKRHLYARAGLPEYWIVRPATRDLLCYWQPDPTLGDYTQIRHIPADGTLDSPTLPIHLTIADIFAGAPDTTW